MAEPELECYKCMKKLIPDIACNMGNGKVCCAMNRRECETNHSLRPLTETEQKDKDEMYEIHKKMLEHCEKVENGEIPSDTPLPLIVPQKFSRIFKQILQSVWDGRYEMGNFYYSKYYKGKYRDAGQGPHYPKWVSDNNFKYSI